MEEEGGENNVFKRRLLHSCGGLPVDENASSASFSFVSLFFA